MENITNARESINSFLSKYTKRQKIIGISAIAAIIIVITLVIVIITRPTYVPLYTGLDLNTMSNVKTALKDMGVNYQIKDKSSIYVKQDEKNRIMVDLAGQNIPKAKFDYSDLLKMNSMFMSDDEKTTARNYALQNAIESVIESIDTIDKAEVTLTIPKTTEFILKENRQIPKASVLVKSKAGKAIDKDTVEGIVTLVTNSVEGLSAENVTVVSETGQILNPKEEENALENMTENIQLQNKVEKDLSNSIHEFLTPTFGYNNVSVMASVKLNFDKNVTQSETFGPPVEGETEGMKRSEQNTTEIVENKNPALGTPGIDANDAQNQVTDYITVDEDNKSNYRRDESTVNYELNKIVNEVEKAKGQIDQISVSVILNKDSLQGGELTDEKKQQIADLVSAASGLDTKSVEVFAESFNKPFDEAAASAEGEKVPIPVYMWIIIAITALIPIVALSIYAYRKRQQRLADEEKERLAKLSEEEKLNEEIEENIDNIELDIKESSHKKAIEDLVDKNPEIVVSLLKTWINED